MFFFGRSRLWKALGVPQYDESHWPQSATVKSEKLRAKEKEKEEFWLLEKQIPHGG